ncbi:uncharacterized protein B0H18DRAFT_1209439 [Fomitopsis serialis]|uniref:uncharacterized protein n=1 Tax=Fomitopsis serialis TaxID=139415 RepID=UPI002007C738|nr:uncharacterized protein B0H18DRAFT_1209439 [Neoantrodia serialis]KAH9930305.1 hypothetical protein B0H18DRAFT_1209439 [Neoantrodia serialis]
MDLTHAVASPIKLIPTELLQKIFYLATIDHWSTHQPEYPDYVMRMPALDLRTVCQDCTVILQTYIDNSRNKPLHIKYTGAETPYNIEDEPNSLWQNPDSNMIKMLANQRHRFLDFNVSHVQLSCDYSVMLVPLVNTGERLVKDDDDHDDDDDEADGGEELRDEENAQAAMLQRLCIATERGKKLRKKSAKRAFVLPALRHLHVTGLRLPQWLRMTNLVTLELTDQIAATVPHWFFILKSNPNLRDVTLMLDPFSFDNASQEVMEATKSRVSQIDLDQLESLSLGFGLITMQDSMQDLLKMMEFPATTRIDLTVTIDQMSTHEAEALMARPDLGPALGDIASQSEALTLRVNGHWHNLYAADVDASDSGSDSDRLEYRLCTEVTSKNQQLRLACIWPGSPENNHLGQVPAFAGLASLRYPTLRHLQIKIDFSHRDELRKPPLFTWDPILTSIPSTVSKLQLDFEVCGRTEVADAFFDACEKAFGAYRADPESCKPPFPNVTDLVIIIAENHIMLDKIQGFERHLTLDNLAIEIKGGTESNRQEVESVLTQHASAKEVSVTSQARSTPGPQTCH